MAAHRPILDRNGVKLLRAFETRNILSETSVFYTSLSIFPLLSWLKCSQNFGRKEATICCQTVKTERLELQRVVHYVHWQN